MYLKWFLQERFVQPLGKTPLPRGSSLVRRLWKVGPDMLSQCSPFPRAPWKTQNVIFKYTSSPIWRGKDSVCTLFVCKIKCLSWLLLNGWLFVIDLLQFISNSLARSKHFPQLSFWSSFCPCASWEIADMTQVLGFCQRQTEPVQAAPAAVGSWAMSQWIEDVSRTLYLPSKLQLLKCWSIWKVKNKKKNSWAV